MTKKRRRKSKAYKEAHPLTPLYLLPVFFIIAIIPLIVFGKVLELDGLEEIYWKGGSLQIDFFQYYKAMYFIAASYIGGLVLLVLYWIDRLDFVKTKYYIPMAIYVFFALISFAFADDMDVAIRGYIEMGQGIFVLIGYMLTVITIFNLVKTRNHIKLLISAFIVVGVVIGIIGIGQYFGHDFFRSDVGKMLILPKELHDQVDSITFNFAEFAIYATLYNTNFVGSFAALMIPFSFALYFYQKKLVYAVLSIGFVGLMVFVGFGSNSRAGLIGVMAALIIIAIVFRKEVIKKPLYVIVPFIALVIIGYGLNDLSDGRIINEIKNLSLKDELNEAEERYDSMIYIDRISFDDNTATIETEDKDLVVDFVNNELYFYTLDGDELSSQIVGRTVTLIDEAYSGFKFVRSEDQSHYAVSVYGRWFALYLTIDGFKFEGLSGDLFVPDTPDKIKVLEVYGSLFSNRTFIWSRAIPLMKDHILIGAGPDMFPIAYPQNDLAGRLNFMGVRTIIDKPHNMYLQTAINTGFISLLALLTVFGMYLVEGVKLFINRSYETLEEYLGAGLMASISAYLVSGIFNDQIMSVGPLFYAMLGLGIAVNQIIKKDALKAHEEKH